MNEKSQGKDLAFRIGSKVHPPSINVSFPTPGKIEPVREPEHTAKLWL